MLRILPRKLKFYEGSFLYKSTNRKSVPASNMLQNLIKLKNPNIFLAISHSKVNKRFMSKSGGDSDGKSKCDSKDNEYKTSARHQFHKDTEAILNEQVQAEFCAAFEYLSIGYYFGRTEVALPGCQGFFMNMYEEELSHANIFSNYVLMRGGYVKLNDVSIPGDKKWTVSEAFSQALQMEKQIKEKLITVFKVAEKYQDLQIMDLVSTDFMEEQNRSICEMARLLTRSKITDTKVGEYLFDQMIFNSFVKKEKENLMYDRKLELVENSDKQGIYK